jgi:hypothetical protein
MASPSSPALSSESRVHYTFEPNNRHNAPVLSIYYHLFLLFFEAQHVLDQLLGQ